MDVRQMRLMIVVGCIAALVVGCAGHKAEQVPVQQPAEGVPASPRIEEVVVGSRSRAEPQRSIQVFAQNRMSGFSGQPPAAPLAAAQPGEEIWVIATTTVTESQTSEQTDDAPGSGAMVTTLKPSDPAMVAEPRTVPLPLKHTDVHAVVAGYVGTVDVTQKFHNPFDEKIEAVYMFPLPEKAAVSEFVMTIGERRIRGILRERKEAERIYREARTQGYQASLLTQHRPNVFEQKVANIEPGRQIDVNIRYFHTLPYQDGWYRFVFPTVVGPRYNPPGSADPLHALPRSQLETPPKGAAVRYLRPEERSAHDISIRVEVDAGVAIEELDASHRIQQTRKNENALTVELAAQATIPNKDFVLSFKVAGDRVKSNLLTYVDPESQQGYFTLMLYPPAGMQALTRQPMEMIFVLDCSGSMRGRPLAQAKQAVLEALDHLGPQDSFQIIRFSDQASQFGSSPVVATAANLAQAKRFVRALHGSGGTQMLEGIKAALSFPHDEERLRFVSFMTDGYIGNEAQILGAVHQLIGSARIFSFGLGNSVNRYLMERMAKEGRGAVAYLGLRDSADQVMDFFFDRISHPAMTDIELVWDSMQVSDVYPFRMPDLFVGRPVIVTGKYLGEAGQATVRGRAGGRQLEFAAGGDDATQHEFIPKLWARLRITDLVDRQSWTPDPYAELAREIRETALTYELMSAYTAFVAVDASRRTEGDHGTIVHQAVPVPEGVQYQTTVEGR